AVATRRQHLPGAAQPRLNDTGQIGRGYGQAKQGVGSCCRGLGVQLPLVRLSEENGWQRLEAQGLAEHLQQFGSTQIVEIIVEYKKLTGLLLQQGQGLLWLIEVVDRIAEITQRSSDFAQAAFPVVDNE